MRKIISIAIIILISMCHMVLASGAKVRIASVKSIWQGAVQVAVAEGYFKDEGVNVEIIIQQAGRQTLDALASGSADIATPGEVPVTFYAFTGSKDLRIEKILSTTTCTAVVGKRSLGILAPEDLRGKRIAYTPGTTNAVYIYRLLKKHGIGLSEVQSTYVQPIAVPTTVIAGGADAGVSFDTYVTQMVKQLGSDAVIFYDPSIYTAYTLMVVRPTWAVTHVEALAKVNKALLRAADFIKQNPTQAQKIISEATSLDVPTVKYNWQYFDFTLRDPQAVLPQLKEEGLWAHDTQEGYQNKPVPDYSIYFDSSHAGKTK